MPNPSTPWYATANSLCVAITQSTDATAAIDEIAALRQLLDRVERKGLLVWVFK